MRISIIVAVAANGVIGRDNELPWHLSDDLRRFKRLTMGHHLLMGRRTFESIGRPLPGRQMVVISRGRPDLPEGVARVGSLEEGLELSESAGETEAFIAGGAQIYALALPLAHRVYRTRIDQEFSGDVRFPPLDESQWTVTERDDHPATDSHPFAFSFELLERR